MRGRDGKKMKTMKQELAVNRIADFIPVSHMHKMLDIRQAKWVLNLTFVAIIANTVFGWHQISTTFSEGEPGSLLVRVITMSPAILGFFIVLSQSKRVSVPHPWNILFRWALITFIISMMMGITGIASFGYSWRYILADAYRYGITWASLYACTVASLSMASTHQETVKRYFDAFVVIALIEVIITFRLSMMFPWAKISTSLYIFLFIWGSMYLSKRPFASSLALLFGATAVMVSGKRGPFITTAMISPLLLLQISLSGLFSFRRMIPLFISFLIFVLFSYGVWLSFEPFQHVKEHFAKRSDSLVNNVLNIVNGFLGDRTVQDESYQGRLTEFDNIDHFYRQNSMLQLLGAGFGAEIPMIYWTGVPSSSLRMHHAHIAWAAYFLRNGLNGVMLLAAYFALCLSMIKKYSHPNGQFAVSLVIITIIGILFSFSGNMMLEGLLMIHGICIGLIYR